MLNEIPFLKYKKLTQTVIYLPYFISWVVIGGSGQPAITFVGYCQQRYKILGRRGCVLYGQR